MKIGIIGGTGNISTQVVTTLLNQGHDVTCITRGVSGLPPEGARSLQGDRNDTEWFIPTVRRENFDAGIDFYSFTPAQGRATLEAFRGTGHLVQVSTIMTVGERFDWLPVTEDHPLRPAREYGINKADIDRQYVAAYYSEGYPTTVVKPFTTYGRERIVRQIGIDTRWIRRIREGRPILRVGGGNALHQLLHVKDAARAFATVLGREHSFGESYFLVNPSHMDWTTVHETAMKVLGRQVEQVDITSDALTAADSQRFQYATRIFAKNFLFSAAKFQRHFPDFRPEISLEDGFADAFEYLERAGHVEEVPLGDWEDQLIEGQRAAIRTPIHFSS